MSGAAASFTVAREEAGRRLDVLVAERMGVSRAEVARLIAAGDVVVEGAAASKALRVQEGMVVRTPEAGEPEPLAAEDRPLRVVYEDEALLVVSKPAGLVVHPGPGHARGTMANALLTLGAAGGDPARPGIVHRLDAGTSGLMIVARGEDAHARLAAMLAAREVHRTYLALVEGLPATETMTIDAPIGRSPRHRKRMAVVAGGKPAITDVAVIERHARTALVRAEPRTGRTHQIRVHLAAAGHPVAGDPVYGRDRALALALGLARPFLHASALSFAHPLTGAPLGLEDPLPPDLEGALDRARAVG
ncbi:MAG TPA: RluA family pseudouridine synthase [Actinomycetota bacterium]